MASVDPFRNYTAHAEPKAGLVEAFTVNSDNVRSLQGFLEGRMGSGATYTMLAPGVTVRLKLTTSRQLQVEVEQK